MTVLTRWNPYRELESLQNRMSRLFEEQYGGREEASMSSGAFIPPKDAVSAGKSTGQAA